MNRNNSHNEFVGNFDSFFDNESSLTGGLDFGGDLGSPISAPVEPPRNPRNLTVASAGPKILLSPAVSFVLDNTPKYRCKVTPPYYVRDDVNGTVLDYTKCPKKSVSVGVSAGPQTPPSSGSGSGSGATNTTTTTSGSGTSETISTGSNQSETTTEQKPSSGEVKKTESDCKINHVLVSGFMIIGIILGYFIAKKFKKDPFIFCITGGIINAIIGYLYSKNKCK